MLNVGLKFKAQIKKKQVNNPFFLPTFFFIAFKDTFDHYKQRLKGWPLKSLNLFKTYRIRPNYRTVHSGFSKLVRTLICGKICTFCIYLLRIHYKKIRKELIWWWLCHFFWFSYKGICCGYSFELHRQVDAIQMSTHNISLYKEVNKRYTDCHLKTTKFLDCVLIGVCAVIRSNTVNQRLDQSPR